MEKCHDTFEQAFEQFALKYIKIVTYDYLYIRKILICRAIHMWESVLSSTSRRLCKPRESIASENIYFSFLFFPSFLFSKEISFDTT